MSCEQRPNKAISRKLIEQLKKIQKTGGKIDFTEAIKRTDEADKRLQKSGKTLILYN